MNEKISDRIEESSKELALLFLHKIDIDFEEWPDDPYLKGYCAKMILQHLTILILGGMKHPNLTMKSLVKVYCDELLELGKNASFI